MVGVRGRENRAPQNEACEQMIKRQRVAEPQTPQVDKASRASVVGQATAASTESRKQSSLERQSETKDFTGPKEFLPAPKGERLLSSEDGARVTRESGVGHGTCYLGPFATASGPGASSLSFEIEILELESRSQTMAIGLTASLPPENQAHLVERAKDLGEGSIIIGYDLPKLYVHGKEEAKVNTKQWRPLKELAVGDRIALCADRGSGLLTVRVNTQERVQLEVPALRDKQRFPSDMWGVVDVYGAVKSVRLVTPGLENATMTPGPVPGPLRQREPAHQKDATPKNEMTETPRSAKKKRIQHPCGCFVHLVDASNQVIHVPLDGLIIGRDPRAAGLVLDSELVPNMVSRRHCHVLASTGDEKVELIDFGSINGTWVNGAKMMRGLLRQGDEIVVGNPAKSPEHFHFKVSMPTTADA